MIPIEKNIFVTDETGKLIGQTYPKRAKGLVRHGRAVFADETTIRMLGTVPEQPHTEEISMINLIPFSARAFRKDEACAEGTAERRSITLLGRQIETYAIGSPADAPAQIVQTQVLAPETDYLLRFAVISGNYEDSAAVSQCLIILADDPEAQFTYDLTQSRYQPVLSKALREGLLRVFEIPVSGGTSGKVTIAFRANRCEMQILPAFENTDYDCLHDLTYDDLQHQQNKRKIDLSGASLTEEALHNILQAAGDAAQIDLSEITMIDRNRPDDETVLEQCAERLLHEQGSLSVQMLCTAFGTLEQDAQRIINRMYAAGALRYDPESGSYLL